MYITKKVNEIIPTKRDHLIVVRGGGDIATGIIYTLWSAGLKVLVLESEAPSAIRRNVSVSEAVYEGDTFVEGMRATLAATLDEAVVIWARGDVPVMVDPKGRLIREAKPAVVVDAILAKKNLGTTIKMAPLTIGVGPGFCAGKDVEVVIETQRGHKLGRTIWNGEAAPNTGVPGIIGGYGAERVIHSPKRGIFHPKAEIGDVVEAGQVIAEVESPGGRLFPVKTQIPGLLRGILREGFYVNNPGFKVADVDPRRSELENCSLISDKARCIAGSVLQLITARLWA